MRLHILLINIDSEKSFRVKAIQDIALDSFYKYIENLIGEIMTDKDKKVLIYLITNIGETITHTIASEKLKISKSSFYRAMSKLKKAKVFEIKSKVITKHKNYTSIKYEYI